MANLPSAAVVPCRLFCSSPSFVSVTWAKWIGSLLPLRTTIPATVHFSVLRFGAAGFSVFCPEQADEISKLIRKIGYGRHMKTSHPEYIGKDMANRLLDSPRDNVCMKVGVNDGLGEPKQVHL